MTSQARAAAAMLLYCLLAAVHARGRHAGTVRPTPERAAPAGAAVLSAGRVASVCGDWSKSRLLATEWLVVRLPHTAGVKHYIFARTESPHVAPSTGGYNRYKCNARVNISLAGTPWMATKSLYHSCNGASCVPLVHTFYKEIPAHIDMTQITKGDIVVKQLDMDGNPLRLADGSASEKAKADCECNKGHFTGQHNETLHADSKPIVLLMARWIIFRLNCITGIKHYLFAVTEGTFSNANETAAIMAEFTIIVKGHGPIWMGSTKHHLCSYADFTIGDGGCNGKHFTKNFDAEIPDYVDVSKIAEGDITVKHILKEHTY